MFSIQSRETLMCLFWKKNKKEPETFDGVFDFDDAFVKSVLTPIVTAMNDTSSSQRGLDDYHKRVATAMVSALWYICTRSAEDSTKSVEDIQSIRFCAGAAWNALHFTVLETLHFLAANQLDYVRGLSVISVATTYVGEKLMAALLRRASSSGSDRDQQEEEDEEEERQQESCRKAMLCAWVRKNPVWQHRLPIRRFLTGLFIVPVRTKKEQMAIQSRDAVMARGCCFDPASHFAASFNAMTYSYLTEVLQDDRVVVAGEIVKSIIMGSTYDVMPPSVSKLPVVDLHVVGARTPAAFTEALRCMFERLNAREDLMVDDVIVVNDNELMILLGSAEQLQLSVTVSLTSHACMEQLILSFGVAPLRCGFDGKAVYAAQSCMDAIACKAFMFEPVTNPITPTINYVMQLACGFRIMCPEVPGFKDAVSYINNLANDAANADPIVDISDIIRTFNGHVFGLIALVKTAKPTQSTRLWTRDILQSLLLSDIHSQHSNIRTRNVLRFEATQSDQQSFTTFIDTMLKPLVESRVKIVCSSKNKIDLQHIQQRCMMRTYCPIMELLQLNE
jgi:hypothetical protein